MAVVASTRLAQLKIAPRWPARRGLRRPPRLARRGTAQDGPPQPARCGKARGTPRCRWRGASWQRRELLPATTAPRCVSSSRRRALGGGHSEQQGRGDAAFLQSATCGGVFIRCELLNSYVRLSLLVM
jgi:hypothetical protein